MMYHSLCILSYVFLLLILLTLKECLPSDDIYQKVLDDLQFEDPRVPRVGKSKKETKNNEEVNNSHASDVEALAKEKELLSECTSKLQLAETEKANCIDKQKNTGAPLFKQLVRKISEVLQPTSRDPSILGAKIILKKEQLIELQSILQKQSKAKDALDLLFQYDAFQALEEESSVWSEWLIRLNLPLVILSCSALPSSFLLLKLLKQLFIQEFHWKRNVFFIIFVGFLCSIPWEWYRMYRVAFSKKTSELLKDTPPECNPSKEISMLQSISLFFSHKFTFADDECAKYHEHLLVDPLWEVSPLNAISVCLSRFLFEPIKLCSEALGVSFRLFFKEIPMQWQPILALGGFLLLGLLIMSCSGLRIETPFLKINTNPHREIRYVQQPPPVQHIAQEEIQQPLVTSAKVSNTQKTIGNDRVSSQKDFVGEENQAFKKSGVVEVSSESPVLRTPDNRCVPFTTEKQQVSTNLHNRNLNEKNCEIDESHSVKQDDENDWLEVKNVVLPTESEHLSIGGSLAVEDIVSTAQCDEDLPSSCNSAYDGQTADSMSLSVHESFTLRRVSIGETPSSVLVPDGSSVFSIPLNDVPSSGILRQRLQHGNAAGKKPTESSNMSQVENIPSGSA